TQKSSTRIRAASSLGLLSPASLPTEELRSAWMARAPGGTTYSSNGYGEASSTKKCICAPTKASLMPYNRLGAISTSTTPNDHTRALTELRPIRPTSRCCGSAWRHNQPRQTFHLSTRKLCSKSRSHCSPTCVYASRGYVSQSTHVVDFDNSS